MEEREYTEERESEEKKEEGRKKETKWHLFCCEIEEWTVEKIPRHCFFSVFRNNLIN